MKISELNDLDASQQKEVLLKFCQCDNWASKILLQSPFSSRSSLEAAMKKCWVSSSEPDLLEAFSAHPKIGDLNILRDKFAKQAHKEQGQLTQANEHILNELYLLNQAYLDKFGFIFIICASGKSAEYMLDMLKLRIEHSRESELQNAANEQLSIMLLRLYQTIEA